MEEVVEEQPVSLAPPPNDALLAELSAMIEVDQNSEVTGQMDGRDTGSGGGLSVLDGNMVLRGGMTDDSTTDTEDSDAANRPGLVPSSSSSSSSSSESDEEEEVDWSVLVVQRNCRDWIRRRRAQRQGIAATHIQRAVRQRMGRREQQRVRA
jgi:hypothetical protein